MKLLKIGDKYGGLCIKDIIFDSLNLQKIDKIRLKIRIFFDCLLNNRFT